MDMPDQLPDGFLSSELDFDLLNDLSLPSDFSILEQDIFMGDTDDTNSISSTSQSSFSEFNSHHSSSIGDSPPHTPSSPFDSDLSPALSPLNSYPTVIKLEPDSDESCNLNLPFIITSAPNLEPGTTITANCITLPKSSRGRSASHDSPDVQAIKRHIRMIRNRESACLSRKKKKDYLTGLETKLKELEAENNLLKLENLKLRTRLKQYSGNNCDQLPRKAVEEVKAAISPVKKTPSPSASKTNRKSQSIPSASAIAKFALFGLFCFMFVNFDNTLPSTGPSYKNRISNLSKSMVNPSDVHIPLQGRGPKHSLIENVPEPQAQILLRSRRSFRLWDNGIEDLPRIPRLNYAKENSTKGRNGNLNATIKNQEFYDNENFPSFRNLTFSKKNTSKSCHHYFNQTEAMRVRNDLKGIFNVNKPLKKKHPPAKPLVYSLMDFGLGIGESGDNKGLAVYNEKLLQYSKLLDRLQRREDTFYVVSLDVENQLLLSAKAHNVTSRPRMTFLMPWKNETLGGKEELMQIDCEVTQVFKVKKIKGQE